MRTSAPPLLAIFRSQLQGELLARILQTSQEPTLTALAKTLNAPLATVAREVSRLEGAGLLTTRRVGRARLVAGNESNPATAPLRQLVTVAFGPQQIVAQEFKGFAGSRKSSSSRLGPHGFPASRDRCRATSMCWLSEPRTETKPTTPPNARSSDSADR